MTTTIEAKEALSDLGGRAATQFHRAEGALKGSTKPVVMSLGALTALVVYRRTRKRPINVVVESAEFYG